MDAGEFVAEESIVTARAAAVGAFVAAASPSAPSSIEGRVERTAAVAEAPRPPRLDLAPLPPLVLPREDMFVDHWYRDSRLSGSKLLSLTGADLVGCDSAMWGHQSAQETLRWGTSYAGRHRFPVL